MTAKPSLTVDQATPVRRSWWSLPDTLGARGAVRALAHHARAVSRHPVVARVLYARVHGGRVADSLRLVGQGDWK
jgi:hypothetical protein